ncbi:peptidoglycan DD-metalloendopeptidase family protein [Pseudactinotalea sp. HY160]|uniref:murein hydrolase activator EnvC family protein n=1 Tax=Pseudactinotalea sp. HY160 TaxID=2654490 RepID=UPI00128C61C3|nr:M23 family metallopeptidase [Pseudactinotalea sp. HY160]MPV50187.1 peptidoglycan DD-metalloendopeptidase family protein [Pseudactinotalea sp. HY160]
MARRTRPLPRMLAALTAFAATAALLLGGLTLPAAAGPKDDLEDQRARNAQEREELEASLEGTDQDLAELYLALDETKRRLPEAEAELEVKNQELDAAERELDAVQDRLAAARSQRDSLESEIAASDTEMDTAHAALGEVARSAYRGGDGISTLAVVFEATSPQEFASSYSVMSSAMRTQNETLAELRDIQAVNRNREARLGAVEDRIGDLEDEAAAAVAAADDARAAAADLVAEISQLKIDQEHQAADLEDAKAASEQELADLKAADAELASQIADIVAKEEAAEARRREEAAKNQNSSKPGSGGGSSSGGGSGGSGGGSGGSGGSGTLIPPVGRSNLHVTSPWGMRWYPFGGRWMHNGVDLRSRCGENQIASAAGTVSAVRPAAGNGTHGNQVMINHGRIGGSIYVTVYNHLSRFAVSTGERVSQGETIGYTGATGKVTGCHVHFEVWKNGSTIDPMGLPGF